MLVMGTIGHDGQVLWDWEDLNSNSIRRRMEEIRNRRERAKKRLYRLPEAAEYLGRSEWSVRRMIWTGALPCVKHGRRVHVDVQDMETFIDQNKVKEV